MRLKSKYMAIVAGAVAVVAAATIAGGVAVANNGDDEELTGATREQAIAAALAFTGEGEVTETEIGDDGAAYEVEIRLDDGRQVEVHLDANFEVLGSADDDDVPGQTDDD